MKLEQQVVSLELAQKLKELGVKQSGYFNWVKTLPTDAPMVGLMTYAEVEKLIPIFGIGYCQIECSAFTVAELGEMLMMLPERNKKGELQHIEYYNTQCNDTMDCDCGGTQNFHVRYILPSKKNDEEKLAHIVIEYPKVGKLLPTEADARAKMLVYLLENKLITL